MAMKVDSHLVRRTTLEKKKSLEGVNGSANFEDLKKSIHFKLRKSLGKMV